jgi:hypothetical protein
MIRLLVHLEQTINGEFYCYHVEATIDDELEPDEMAHHVGAVGAELQAMAATDRKNAPRFDWNRILPGLS